MKKIFLFILTTLAVFGSCDKDKVVDSGPSLVPTLEVNKTRIEAFDSPANYTIAVTSNGAWKVVVGTEGTQWCTVSPSSGTGNRTVTLTVEGNPTQSKRYATLWFSSGQLTQEVAVSQYIDVAGFLNMVPVSGSIYLNISDFKIGKYEVTQQLWGKVMGNSPDQSPDKRPSLDYGYGDNFPMYYVSYNDAQEFIVALNELTGKTYRLPTSAEWEYAAKGGQWTRGYIYSGSNNIDAVAWYLPDMNPLRPDLPTAGIDVGTREVGRLLANELGLYDMTGNVWEWCSDGIFDTTQFAYRGGSWWSFKTECTFPSYGSHEAKIRLFNVGFRVVLPE